MHRPQTRSAIISIALLATATLAMGAAAGDLLNTKAEQNEPRITSAGARATPNRALAGEQPKTEPGVAGQAAQDDGWLEDIAVRFEANNKGQLRKSPLLATVIHSTRGKDPQSALAKVRTGEETWHFTIDRDGMIYQHVSLNRNAAHAGHAFLVLENGTSTTAVNQQTLGIELVNLGGVVKAPGDSELLWTMWNAPYRDKETGKDMPAKLGFKVEVEPDFKLEKSGILKVGNTAYDAYYEPFPEKQIEGLIRLLRAIELSKWHDGIVTLVSHQRIATNPLGRKIDPGPLFPGATLGYRYLP